ncbi:30S ribosomal protein THX [bacterium]|nr:30S ribosomal protein THX [bacterium]
MGKGDRRTRRGKIWRGTNGKSHPKKGKKKKQKAKS